MIAWLLATPLAHALPPPVEWKYVPDPVVPVLGETCFPSGLRVTVREDHRQPFVGVTVAVGHGSWDDPAGREGAAHLLEHAWLHGRPGGGETVEDRLLSAGATWTVRTMPHATLYLLEVPPAGAPAVLSVLGGLLTDPLAGVDDAALAAAKAEVTAELRDPSQLAWEDLPRLLAPDLVPPSAGGITALETPEGTARLGLAELREVADAYVAWNANLVIAGDLTTTAAERAAASTLPEPLLTVAADGSRPEMGTCAPRALPALDAPEQVPPRSKPGGELVVVHAPVDGPRLLVGWAVPPGLGELGGAALFNAYYQFWRIYEDLVYGHPARQERFDPTCRWLPDGAASTVVCSVRVPEGTSPELLRDKVIGSLAEKSTGEQYASNVVIARRELSKRTYELAADRVAEIAPIEGDDGVRAAYAGHLAGSAIWFADAVNAFAKFDPAKSGFYDAWLVPDRAVVRLVVPTGVPDAVVTSATSPPDLEGRMDRAYQTDARHPLWDEPRHLAPARLPATPVAAPAPRVPDVREAVLPNGVHLLVVRTDELAPVRVALVSASGRENEPVPGLSDWAWMQHQKSTDDIPTDQSYTDTTILLGSVLREGDSRHGRYVLIDGTKSNLPGMLYLASFLSERLVVEPSGSHRTETRTAVQALAADEQHDPGARADEARLGALLGSAHPLAMGPWRRVAGASAATEKELRAWFDRAFEPSDVTAVVIGGVDPDATVQLATKMFQGIRPSKAVPPRAPAYAPPAFSPVGPFRQGFDDPRRGATEVRVACRVGADPVAGEVGRLLVQDRVAGAVGDARVELLRWRDDAVLQVTVQAEAGRAAADADALVALLDGLAAAVPAPAVSSAGARAAEVDLLRWADDEFVFDRALEHRAALAEVARGRGDALRAVQPDAVAAWLAPCAGHTATTLVGPGAGSP